MRLIILSTAIVVCAWLSLIAWLVWHRHDASTRDAARLVPDAVRLIRRLATDRAIPRSSRLPVWLLIGYLASPIDLVPDFVPIVGYADDVILISVVLRRLVRHAGADKLSEHWPGTPEGLATFRRLLRIRSPD